MNKKYFDTRKDSLEDKINTIASEQVAFSKPVSDVKLSVEKKYLESKQGSLEEIASKVVSESFIKENTYAFDYNFELYMPSTSQRGDGDAIKEYEGTIKASGKDAAEAKPKAEKELQKRIDAAEKATKGTLEGENLGSGRAVSEGMDPVNKDAVKKKFDDRKDKDIDNDGDTDSSDKFLHKRRKAISKAMKENKLEACGLTTEACWDSHKQVGTKMKGGKQVPNCVPKNEAITQDDHGEKINQDKKDAAMKKTDQKKPFNKLRQETKLVRLGNNGKTDTGQKAAVIDLEPSARPI
tara:strand:+ start:127 stop:1011 length:885 start_codon:yes stop_codon:yes gene_type:complete